MFSLDRLLESARWKKRVISVIVDFFALIFIALFAIWLRFGDTIFPVTEYINAIFLLPLLAIPIFIKLGLYRAVIRYISYRFVFVVFTAVSIAFLFWASIIFLIDVPFPRSALVIAWLLAILYLSASRLVVRWLLLSLSDKNINADSVVIYGAGESGRQLMNAMQAMKNKRVVAFIDDDKQLHNHKIGSVKVYSKDSLDLIIEKFNVKEILLAVPSFKLYEKKELLDFLEPFPVKVSTLPSIEHIVDGKVLVSDVREIEIEDLLGRDVVPSRKVLLERFIKDKNVFVSGAGGSIGSELCRQIVKLKPKRLILFELSELALYQIEKELIDGKVELIAVLGSVLNEKKLDRVFKCYQINTVYHAAAYKHVPIVEHNIEEGIRNNSFGTLCLAQVAAQNKVQNFVLISTDKAVRPTNFMGASKRLAEMALQALQDEFKDTLFVIVRFGNVLGSSGSVIPLFRKQIINGGPVTVTHKDITRYFMTIPEAASLVIQAGSMGAGGEVFVLDMGEPVKIIDLAKKVIHLSGLEIMDEKNNGDIEIKFTGLRPGEKLFEELLIGDDVDGTEHPRIMKVYENYIKFTELEKEFKFISDTLDKYEYDLVSEKLSKIVSGFNHNSTVVDNLKS